LERLQEIEIVTGFMLEPLTPTVWPAHGKSPFRNSLPVSESMGNSCTPGGQCHNPILMQLHHGIEPKFSKLLRQSSAFFPSGMSDRPGKKAGQFGMPRQNGGHDRTSHEIKRSVRKTLTQRGQATRADNDIAYAIRPGDQQARGVGQLDHAGFKPRNSRMEVV
jgi:hypothetical protein